MLEDDGMLVIADIFDKKDVPEIESEMKKLFRIRKKDSYTFEVRHALSLDAPRLDE
jgi:hypothetical protein